jgi:hypothetical protein
MNCVIEGIDFYELEAMRYYSPSTSWSAEKKKENAEQKIFSSDWLGSLKRDGTFCMCGRNQDGEIFLRPRARNVKKEFVNKVDWVPQFHQFLKGLDPGTVFLGEVYLPLNEQAKATTSILNCLLPKSLKRQEDKENRLYLYIFDVLAENGKSYLNMRAEERFDLLNAFSRAYSDEYVSWARYYEGNELWDKLQEYLSDGREGMVITHKDSPYEPGKRSAKRTLKIKKELQETIDCVIIGANPPTKLYTGKEPEIWEYWFDETTNEKILAKDFLEKNHQNIYTAYAEGATVIPVTKNWFYGWAGSLKLGLYDKDNLVHVGDLSGVTDEMKENWKDYVGAVAEISCMEITENQQGGWGFRHPKLLSIRLDKAPTDCTIEQIK